jgi:hypothetical protein
MMKKKIADPLSFKNSLNNFKHPFRGYFYFSGNFCRIIGG